MKAWLKGGISGGIVGILVGIFLLIYGFINFFIFILTLIIFVFFGAIVSSIRSKNKKYQSEAKPWMKTIWVGLGIYALICFLLIIYSSIENYIPDISLLEILFYFFIPVNFQALFGFIASIILGWIIVMQKIKSKKQVPTN